ncbi:hypothetical protein MRX96_056650 [Rhipicephalus microplus]
MAPSVEASSGDREPLPPLVVVIGAGKQRTAHRQVVSRRRTARPWPCNTMLNSSKEFSAYSDFPPHASCPNFMHHSGMLEYLTQYSKHFDLDSHIPFQPRCGVREENVSR